MLLMLMLRDGAGSVHINSNFYKNNQVIIQSYPAISSPSSYYKIQQQITSASSQRPIHTNPMSSTALPGISIISYSSILFLCCTLFYKIIQKMSSTINLKLRHKSPYKTMFSPNRPKHPHDTARKIYLQDLSNIRSNNAKSMGEESYRKFHSSSRNIIRDLHINLEKQQKYRYQEKQPFSDRKASQKKKSSLLKNELSTGRYSKLSKTKMYPSGSKIDKYAGEKSTAIETLLSQYHLREQKMKEDKQKHLEGKNCRVIVIDGNQQVEHYIEATQMGDINAYLRKEYPKICYFKSVPVQITLDYLLTQKTISGQFLNGQSLYLKPAWRDRSVDERQSLCLDSFEIIKLIGSGGFSKVFLCRFKKDGNFYAMKVIDKQVIIKNKKKNIIMNERNIMKSINHPFLIDMKFAFETHKFLIFVVEYCPGGQLFGLIKKYKRISEEISRFYIIQIFLGLSYLHQNKVVYRDIKPQNILLGQDGHVKIADLGLAKPDMFDGELAYSFCGSPEYMSPEMILQVGHTYPVDFYCMGALLYELLIGLPPFYSRDTNQIYEAVLSEDLQFPEDIQLTPQCKSLLRGLLCKDSKQRLGSIHGVKQILAHPWFGKNAYKSFLQKKITPPITFDSVGRIDLDRQPDEKKSKQLEQMLKHQKTETLKFKHEMKHFYFDHSGLTEQFSECSNKQNKQKLLLRSSSGRRLNVSNKFANEAAVPCRKSIEKQVNKTLNSLNSSRR